MFVHFTTERDAEAIVASGHLWADRHHEQVYACEIGKTRFYADVCITLNASRSGAERTHAVVFDAPTPDQRSRFEEEVTWDLPALTITDGFAVPAAEAIEILLASYSRPTMRSDGFGAQVPVYNDGAGISY